MRAELDELLPVAASDMLHFAGAHIFLTGGTGYVGKNFLESVAWANDELGAGIKVTVLARDPNRARLEIPQLLDRRGVNTIQGDVRRPLPMDLRFDAMLHAATPASAALNIDHPLEMLDTIIDGGRNVLALASRSGAIPYLFTSSGAVYGMQPADRIHQTENAEEGPDQLSVRSAYAEGKRVAELQCALQSAASGLDVKIARIYAQIGPYLQLDRHFAAGNFLRDAMAGREILVQGDGSTVRSYLYATETVCWLWAIFARGEKLRPYNVGSEEAISTKALAKLCAEASSAHPPVKITGTNSAGPIDRYVPSTARIRSELGVEQRIALRDAVERSIRFFRLH